MVSTLGMAGCTSMRIAHRVDQSYIPPERQLRPSTRSYAGRATDDVWEAALDTALSRSMRVAVADREAGLLVVDRPFRLGENSLEWFAPGEIVTRVQPYEQELQPDRAADTGKRSRVGVARVLSSVPTGTPRTQAVPGVYRADARITFRVRTVGEATELQVSALFLARDDLPLVQGFTSVPDARWANDLRLATEDPMLEAQIVTPEPQSHGTLERILVEAVSRRLLEE